MEVAKKDRAGFWTEEAKVLAVRTLITLGNLRKTAETTGIPYRTLIEWREEPWWNTILQEIKVEDRTKTQNKLTDITGRALDVVQDRMENGDFILNNKTGEVVRKPVSVKDAAKVASDFIQRSVDLQKATEEMNTTKETIEQTMKKLAEEFVKFNRKSSKVTAETIEYTEVK